MLNVIDDLETGRHFSTLYVQDVFSFYSQNISINKVFYEFALYNQQG